VQHRAVPDLEPLLRHAALHHGVVDTGSVAQLGVSRSAVRTAVRHGVLRPVARGVYLVAGAPRSWEQQTVIATTALGGVASHRCAARLHRLDGFGDAPVELTLPRSGTRRHLDGVVLHWTRSMPPAMTTTVQGIRVTTLARTLADLGAVVDDDAVEQALDDALRRGFNLRWITETLDESLRPGPTGCAALLRVLARPDRAGALPDSRFERLAERVCALAGLPPPERQHRVVVEGRLIAVIDVAWPSFRLGLEADSELWHWGPRRGRVARQRHNRLTAQGWEMIYASWQDVADPAELVRNLSLAAARAAR
jgi:hypothetical protein